MMITEEQRRLFVQEVARQCQQALVAFERLEQHATGADRASIDTVYEAVESFVSQIGKISRFFFVTSTGKDCNPGEVRARADWLREHLKVLPDSLLRDRTMRDKFDHFDEKLHAGDSGLGFVVTGNVGPAHAISAPSATWFKHFDPHTLTVYFGKEPFELRPVRDEIARIRDRAEEIVPLS